MSQLETNPLFKSLLPGDWFVRSYDPAGYARLLVVSVVRHGPNVTIDFIEESPHCKMMFSTQTYIGNDRVAGWRVIRP